MEHLPEWSLSACLPCLIVEVQKNKSRSVPVRSRREDPGTVMIDLYYAPTPGVANLAPLAAGR
ncbi:MAG TPA: hypothetical protein VII39_05560 [Bradyrhizobium sp.]